jgi:hypothetical protein
VRPSTRITRQVRRRGAAVVYGIVAFSVLVAFCSLAVDYGAAQLVRTELQGVADGAARAAAGGINVSVAEAKARARHVGSMNRAANQGVTFADADFRFGRWNSATNQLDVNGTPIDAVEITARREATLVFGAMFGKGSVDVAAYATARAPTAGAFGGFVGLNGITFLNTAYIGSYRSTVTTTPTPASSTGKGIASSNVSVEFKNNADINGDVVLGPAGNLIKQNNFTVSGSVVNKPTEFTPPADPAWAPTSNPNGVPQNYTVTSDTVLPGGTYWFTSLTATKRLTFSGPAVLYINGNVTTDDDIVTYQNKPSNLRIYQLGANRTMTFEKQTSLYAEVQAPGSALVAKNNFYLYGAGMWQSIEAKNQAEFYFDEDASIAKPATGVTLVH